MALRVLVVDDDTFTRAALPAALQNHGYDVRAAADPQEAIREFMEHRPRVCVLDLHLGEGPTGLDLAKALRRVDPRVGLVLLTSFTDPRLLTGSLPALPQDMAHIVKGSLSGLDLLTLAIDVAGGVSDACVPTPPPSSLSDSQVDTLRLLAAGLSNAEIARLRVVSLGTVEKAIARIAKSFDVPLTGDINQRVALALAYYRLTGLRR